MIYTNQTKKAIRLMYRAHKDQTDKSGLPYVFHPWHVAESMEDENSTVVALLHDVVEDTDITLDDLRGMGFHEEVLEALSLMTRTEGEDYFVYVRRLAQNPIARRVKLADLAHNSDLSRLDKVTDKDRARREKYRKAEEMLRALEKML